MPKDLLIEIGTEELPPKALLSLAKAFEHGIREELVNVNLVHSKTRYFATPRRLGVIVEELSEVQGERRHERRGPSLNVAYDKSGNPTQALLGFARSCGVEVNELQTLETEKGAWLVNVTIEPGSSTTDLVPQILEKVLATLPIPKRMRWGNQVDEFVRPVHWVVLLFGNDLIPAQIMGVKAGSVTYGHRFHHPGPLPLSEPKIYNELLNNQGHVIADFNERRELIRIKADAAAKKLRGKAKIDEKLLDEVTALVEWPVVLVGGFEQRFLNVPAEALITTMQDNQKYFPVLDELNRLMPYFITVANLESKQPEQIVKGNERVIRPRFSDAEFFWQQDCKKPLAERQEKLKKVVFQKRLGSLHDKSERVAMLARYIAEHSGSNPDWAERAARLAKCDLLTLMVQEFPELQGIMGRYYAYHDGEVHEVACAQEEQYWPRFAGDRLPTSPTGRNIALADRLDTLVGIFAIGQVPSGTKDPFALRRAALGILRIIIESKLDLDLKQLLEQTAHYLPPSIEAAKAVSPVFHFMIDRLRSYYLEQNIRPDILEAVLSCLPTRPLDCEQRIRAVTIFRDLPEAESLTAANKRIRNILKQTEEKLPFEVQTELLTEEGERMLAGRLVELSSEVIPLMDSGFYSEALNRLATLHEPVDRFFDDVMVMTDDRDLRSNRIALLNQLSSLFLRVADFSLLQHQS